MDQTVIEAGQSDIWKRSRPCPQIIYGLEMEAEEKYKTLWEYMTGALSWGEQVGRTYWAGNIKWDIKDEKDMV